MMARFEITRELVGPQTILSQSQADTVTATVETPAEHSELLVHSAFGLLWSVFGVDDGVVDAEVVDGDEQ